MGQLAHQCTFMHGLKHASVIEFLKQFPRSQALERLPNVADQIPWSCDVDKRNGKAPSDIRTGGGLRTHRPQIFGEILETAFFDHSPTFLYISL